MDLPIELMRSKSTPVECDYVWLMSAFQDYAAPRDVITRLMQRGALVRVKKGLYVLGAAFRHRPISLELLANLIYGPSYISREYALSYYGLIPEGVNEITSMTNKRNKYFDTPVGRFDYRYLNDKKYCVGIQLVTLGENIQVLMASPEKALADLLTARKENVRHSEQLIPILLEDYRIDEANLGILSAQRMDKVALQYQHPTVSLLPNVIRLFQ